MKTHEQRVEAALQTLIDQSRDQTQSQHKLIGITVLVTLVVIGLLSLAVFAVTKTVCH